MPSAKIKLTEPIEVFGKRVSEVELKEPNGGLYVRLGDPRTPVFGASGSMYYIENAEVIARYLDALLLGHEHGGEALLAQLSLNDAVAVKMRLLNFFDLAAVASMTSAAAQTSSSSI